MSMATSAAMRSVSQIGDAATGELRSANSCVRCAPPTCQAPRPRVACPGRAAARSRPRAPPRPGRVGCARARSRGRAPAARLSDSPALTAARSGASPTTRSASADARAVGGSGERLREQRLGLDELKRADRRKDGLGAGEVGRVVCRARHVEIAAEDHAGAVGRVEQRDDVGDHALESGRLAALPLELDRTLALLDGCGLPDRPLRVDPRPTPVCQMAFQDLDPA